MKVICPLCGEALPGTDLDLRRGVGACRPCGEVVPLPVPVRDSEGNAVFLAKEITGQPLSAYRPTDLNWDESRQGSGRFRFAVTSDRSVALFLLFLSLVWNYVLISWIAVAGPEQSSLFRLWGPLFYLAGGLVFTYTALCGLLNRTEMVLSQARFTLGHRPLPQRGSMTEPTRNIRCFVESEQIGKGAKDRWFRPTVSWNVQLLTRDNRSHLLRLYLRDRHHARYATLRLNRALDEIRALEGASAKQAPAAADAPG